MGSRRLGGDKALPYEGTNGIKQASRFSWEKTAEGTLKVYRELENSLRVNKELVKGIRTTEEVR